MGLVLAMPALAEEQIDDFMADISVKQNAEVQVKETIKYDFGAKTARERHGIFRSIPYSYQARGGKYNLRIDNIAVTDEQGAVVPFTVNYAGGDMTLRIGDANKTVAGKQIYIITYTVRRAINYFTDHDELFWNVTSNGWPIPIYQAKTVVRLPDAAVGNTNAACYVGALASTQACETKEVIDGHLEFAQNGLSPGESLTIVVGWPTGVVFKPPWWSAWLEMARDNWIVILPLFTLVGLIFWWRRKGRDKKGNQVLIAQYEPPQGLVAAEVGTIIDESADNVDITADIIQLAVAGYLKIKREENKSFLKTSVDYTLVKLKGEEELTSNLQRELMKNLFTDENTIKLSALKNKFYKNLKEQKDLAYKSVVKRGYFYRRPDYVRLTYGIGGVVIGILLSFVTGQIWGAIGMVSAVVTGLLVAIFGIFMPKRTKKGVDMQYYILGFKKYLSVAEKDRLAFHNAPEKSPERFEKLLPYAIALGVEKKWAKQFDGIYNQPPSWYEGGWSSGFIASGFVSELNSFSDTANKTLSSSPSSAAGGESGFSGGAGGGFGGGGGGSW